MDLNMDMMNDWNKWKKALSKTVSMGETVGMSENTIKNMGVKIGEILASNIDPENHEQRLLKDLFTVGSEKERQALTSMIIKMVQEDQ
ncbi:MAG: DUF3243 domain-containing protein [Marinisporobacter sp.]|nr:DUF3243 domain-containing protein [Marinisporobacter sp.]